MDDSVHVLAWNVTERVRFVIHYEWLVTQQVRCKRTIFDVFRAMENVGETFIYRSLGTRDAGIDILHGILY